jgi:hypothetical protein
MILPLQDILKTSPNTSTHFPHKHELDSPNSLLFCWIFSSTIAPLSLHNGPYNYLTQDQPFNTVLWDYQTPHNFCWTQNCTHKQQTFSPPLSICNNPHNHLTKDQPFNSILWDYQIPHNFHPAQNFTCKQQIFSLSLFTLFGLHIWFWPLILFMVDLHCSAGHSSLILLYSKSTHTTIHLTGNLVSATNFDGHPFVLP